MALKTSKNRQNRKEPILISYHMIEEREMEEDEHHHQHQHQHQHQQHQGQVAMAIVILISGTLVYYHCSFRNSSFISLLSDVFLVILCSLAILGLLFRHFNISVPVDPLEWQISQDTANNIFACLANTVGAAESVLRVAATGHDKRLFVRVVVSLYLLSVLGRIVSGVTVAYAGLCLFCLYMFVESSLPISSRLSRYLARRENAVDLQD